MWTAGTTLLVLVALAPASALHASGARCRGTVDGNWPRGGALSAKGFRCTHGTVDGLPRHHGWSPEGLSRRGLFGSAAATAVTAAGVPTAAGAVEAFPAWKPSPASDDAPVSSAPPAPAVASTADAGTADAAGAADAQPTVTGLVEAANLKGFRDPQGMFALALPKPWFKVRPTDKGDLPDESGKGRRGSRIFSAGLLSNQFAPKILSVERFPVALVLADAGISVGQDKASLSSWASLGKGERLAELLTNRRDAEANASGRPSSTAVLPGSVVVSGATLSFISVTTVEVMRPDLLEEQIGKRQLRRYTRFRGEIRGDSFVTSTARDPVNGQPVVTALWISVEEGEWESGDDMVTGAIAGSFEVP